MPSKRKRLKMAEKEIIDIKKRLDGAIDVEGVGIIFEIFREIKRVLEDELECNLYPNIAKEIAKGV